MPRTKIIPYNPKLKQHARYLRENSTLAEVLLWQQIKGSSLDLGVFSLFGLMIWM